MRRIPVESSDIVSIGHDQATNVLEVEFGGGRIYQYRDVPSDIHAQFMKAASYGQYFFAHVNGRYRYERVGKPSSDVEQQNELIAFVTGNKEKLQYLQQALEYFNLQAEQFDLPIDEIQSDSATDIALKKAKDAYRLVGRPVVVNDAFWNILALRGFPGAYMSPVVKWLRTEDFLKLLDGHTDRTIVLTDTYAYYDGKRAKTFSREHQGRLLQEPRGEGIPITQLVILHGKEKTIAELNSAGASSIDAKESAAYDLAKWLNMQRRLGLI